MKAVIETGAKQYIVEKGDTLEIELIGDEKNLTFEPLMLIDAGGGTKVGTPTVKGAKVSAKVIDPSKKTDKVIIVKFQAKKRVHSKNGHRQSVSVIEITDISSK
jgi:large subunit ribosomal protein L21